MKVLIIGNGGREHALAWKISKSPLVEKIYCAPGNGGTYSLGENISIKDIPELRRFAEKNNIELTVVGPEQFLAKGIVDYFKEAGLKIFGPDKLSSEIEWSKSYTKRLLKENNIPTASFEVFSSFEDIVPYLKRHGFPLVLKADGLAGGKGAVICKTIDEALDTADDIMNKKIFGNAGRQVIVEEYLSGEEASFLAFTDGKTILPMISAQDHKSIFDNDTGPNTGGMGAYSPAPVVTKFIKKSIINGILYPTINALAKEDRVYKGVIYAGLMIKDGRAKVLEFNARLGDPETQPILMKMKSDLVPIMIATIEGRLEDVEIEWDERPCVCVVMASKGYPGHYEVGKPIKGLESLPVKDTLMAFHAGTAMLEDKLVTHGGRVLGITAIGKDMKEAIDMAYKYVGMIEWEGVYYRKDIGNKAVFK